MKEDINRARGRDERVARKDGREKGRWRYLRVAYCKAAKKKKRAIKNARLAGRNPYIEYRNLHISLTLPCRLRD